MPAVIAAPAFWAAAVGGAASTAGTVLASGASGKAADRATAAQTAANDRAYAWEREAEAARRAEADRVAAEARRQWDVEETNRVLAQEKLDEERLWNRDRLTRMDANREPFRLAALDALGRVPGIIQQGAVSPAAAMFVRPSGPLTMRALLPKERR